MVDEDRGDMGCDGMDRKAMSFPWKTSAICVLLIAWRCVGPPIKYPYAVGGGPGWDPNRAHNLSYDIPVPGPLPGERLPYWFVLTLSGIAPTTWSLGWMIDSGY